MERRLAPQFAFVILEDGSQVESRNSIKEEIDEIVFREPVLRRRGKHVGLIGGPFAIGLTHRTISPDRVTAFHGPPDYSNLAFERQYSDGLLGGDRQGSAFSGCRSP